MKALPRPIDVMKTMCQYIADAYREMPAREKGTIQFSLHEDEQKVDCFFVADGHELRFFEGVSESCDVRLDASLADWLRLAENRLNPFWGVITRRLKFSGDVSCFKRIIPADLYKVDLGPFTDPVGPFESSPRRQWKRPRKVLLIDSSPRGTRGYTKLYCDFIESVLREEGAEVEHVVLSQHKIQQCRGCLHCWLKEGPGCIITDDVKGLYEKYDEADLVVYAFPLYAYSVPGILKDFMDRGVMRQYPYFEKGISEIRHPRREKRDHAVAVFSICGFPSFSQFDSVRALFRLYSHSSHSPLVAEIYRPGGIFLLQNPFNYEKLQRFLDALRRALHEIIEQGAIAARTKKMLGTGLDETVFLPSTNKYWDNLFKARDANY